MGCQNLFSDFNAPSTVQGYLLMNLTFKILLPISCFEHKTNAWVQSKISFRMGPQEPFLATIKRQKLALVGHVTRHDSLSKTILQGTLEGGAPWSAEEILDGQHQRMDIPAHTRIAHKDLLWKRLEGDLC